MNPEVMRVLLIEDNPGDARLIREMLAEVRGGFLPGGRQTYDLVCADRLSAGLQVLAAGDIDGVLLDLGLPDSWGLDTFARVHAQAQQVPIVVLTGLDDEALAVKAVQAGAQDYLVKGQVDGSALVRAMRYAMERHQLLAQLEQRTRQLHASETRLRTIIENNADGIVIVDKKGIVRFANPAAEVLFLRKADDLLAEAFGYPMVPGETMEIEITPSDGETRVAEMRVAEIELHGETLFVVSLHDITALAQLREELRTMSLVDDLTGVYNRRGFFSLAQQLLKLAHRTQRGMLLLLADLDGMKGINDRLGHHQGDLALAEIAQALKKTFRDSDIVARIGGDEFAVLAIEAMEGSAEVLVTRLQENLEVRNAQKDRHYKLSLSVGVACYDPKSPCSMEELMRSADRRMYEHKRNKGLAAFSDQSMSLS